MSKRKIFFSFVLEQLRKDLSRTHSNEIEEKERAHGKELSAVRLQLNRALELTKIKVCKIFSPFIILYLRKCLGT
jgi:hypothetical protein